MASPAEAARREVETCCKVNRGLRARSDFAVALEALTLLSWAVDCSMLARSMAGGRVLLERARWEDADVVRTVVDVFGLAYTTLHSPLGLGWFLCCSHAIRRDAAVLDVPDC